MSFKLFALKIYVIMMEFQNSLALHFLLFCCILHYIVVLMPFILLGKYPCQLWFWLCFRVSSNRHRDNELLVVEVKAELELEREKVESLNEVSTLLFIFPINS